MRLRAGVGLEFRVWGLGLGAYCAGFVVLNKVSRVIIIPQEDPSRTVIVSGNDPTFDHSEQVPHHEKHGGKEHGQ